MTIKRLVDDALNFWDTEADNIMMFLCWVIIFALVMSFILFPFFRMLMCFGIAIAGLGSLLRG